MEYAQHALPLLSIIQILLNANVLKNIIWLDQNVFLFVNRHNLLILLLIFATLALLIKLYKTTNVYVSQTIYVIPMVAAQYHVLEVNFYLKAYAQYVHQEEFTLLH